MYQKKDVKIEPLTPELAKEISTMPGLPGERALRSIRLNFLEEHLNQGSFVGPNWATATCRTTGDRYRINGQHSSTLLAKLKPEVFPQGLLVTIDLYEFDSLTEDSAGLFNLFDHPRSARTDSDYMGIHRAHHSDLADIDNPFLIKVTNGISFREKLRQQAQRTLPLEAEESPEVTREIRVVAHRDHGLYLAEDQYRQFALWLYQWRESRNATFVNRAGIVCEILNDWEYDPTLATEFWGFVFDGNHPDPDHETRQFVDAVKDMVGKPKAKQADYQKRAKKFWSRYRKFREAETRIGKTAEAGKSDEAGAIDIGNFSLPPSSAPELRPQL